MKKVIYRGKGSKTLSEVKPVRNINKNPQSFLEIITVQKEVKTKASNTCKAEF